MFSGLFSPALLNRSRCKIGMPPNGRTGSTPCIRVPSATKTRSSQTEKKRPGRFFDSPPQVTERFTLHGT